MRKKIINYLIYLLVFSLCLGQFGKISFGSGISLYIHDILVLFILFGRRRLPKLKLLKPILAFASIAFLSLLLAISQLPFANLLISSLYLWRWLAFAAVFFAVRQNQPKNLTQALIASGFVVAVSGLLQYILLPDTRFLFTSFWDDHYYRLIGTFFDPNFTGLYLSLTILLIIQNFKFIKKQNHFAICYLLFVICVSALALTFSRSSYLAFLTGLFFIFAKSIKKFIVFMLVFTLFIFMLPKPGGEGVNLLRNSSINARLLSSQQTLKLIKQKPLLGHGFNTLRFIRQDFTSHSAAGADNSFIFLLATTGIIGLIIYLWLLKEIWVTHFALRPLLLAFIIHAQFVNSLFFAPLMLYFWLIISDTKH